MYKLLSWTLVIAWMTFIFYLSHQPAVQSDKLSMGIVEVVVEKIERIAPSVEFDLRSLNHLIRKNAHFFAYFLLGVMATVALKSVGVKGYRSVAWAIFICVLYAISDETHQLFVPGRGAQVKDVLIDSAGAVTGIGVTMVIHKFLKIAQRR